MAQFIVRLYPNRHGVRVVVDGITHFDAPGREAAGPLAADAILARLRAFLPSRAPPPVDPEAIGMLFFEVSLREVGPPEPVTPPPEEGTSPSVRPVRRRGVGGTRATRAARSDEGGAAEAPADGSKGRADPPVGASDRREG